MGKQGIQFPLTNAEFLKVISNSFKDFISSGTSRSTAKLKPLHGAIAKDIAIRLGDEYKIFSLGYEGGSETSIEGRYINKKVDITITKKDKTVAGIAVKFVMQNYSQNSNNYFENMLGETANIRTKGLPYFQIFIILDKIPYYNKKKEIKRWETFTGHNVEKYLILSYDNIDLYFHSPNKTLIYVVHIPDNDNLSTLDEYLNYYRLLDFSLVTSDNVYSDFGEAVIINDYETFIDKVYHTIMSI
jgi:hypothetical protein